METIYNNLTQSHIISAAVYKDDGLRTIPDCLRYYADTLQDQEMFVFADWDGGRLAVTWREVYEKSVNTAKSLVKLGVRKGELVGINIRQCAEWLYLAYGAMFAGAAPVCLSFTYKDGKDVLALIKKMETCSLLALDPGVDGEKWETIKRLVDSYMPDGTVNSSKMPDLRYLIGCEHGASVMEGVKHLDELVSEESSGVSLPDIHEDDIAFMVQTSGSTGLPKLVVHTHKTVLQTRQSSGGGMFDASVIQYNDRPFTWISGFPMNAVFGMKRVTINGFSPEPVDRLSTMVKIIQRERCTDYAALVPQIHDFVKYQDLLPENWPLTTVLTGGQPLTSCLTDVFGKLAPSLTVAYGGSEFIAFSTGRIDNKDNFRDFHAGKMIDIPGYEAKVVDDNGHVVPVNTKGEFYFKTPTMFKEYYNDPDKTSKVMTADGWYKTDDIGMITEDGQIFVYGRKSNLIISGGLNVIPDIIEQVIESCPGVSACMIVPVSDPIYYKVLCACVVKDDSDLTEQDIRKYCQDIHNDKPGIFTVLPKFYIFLDELPLTTTGKASRKDLTLLAEDKFAGKASRKDLTLLAEDKFAGKASRKDLTLLAEDKFAGKASRKDLTLLAEDKFAGKASRKDLTLLAEDKFGHK